MLQDQAPKFWPMVHMLAVSHFVGRDIIQDVGWRQDQPPVEGEITGCRTGAPAAFLIAD